MRLPIALFIILISSLNSAAIADEFNNIAIRLTSGDFINAEKAEADLVELGAAALPRIEKLLAETKDEDLQERLQSAALRIKRNKQLLGTMFDCDRTFNSSADAFNALATEIGLPLSYINEAAKIKANIPKPIRLKGKTKPILQAWDEISLAADLECRLENDRLVVINFPSPKQGSPAYYSGATAIRLIRTSRSRNRNFTNGTLTENLNLEIVVESERKTKLLGKGMSIELINVRDNDGRLIIKPESHIATLHSYNQTAQATLSLSVLTPSSRNIVKLEGVLHGLSISKSIPQIVEDLTNTPATTFLYGDMTVNVSIITRADKRLQLDFQFTGDTAIYTENGLRYSNVDSDVVMPKQTVVVTDVNKQKLELIRLDQEYKDNWPVISFLIVAADAKPKRLVWESVFATRELNIPFSFHDIRLPD